MPPNCPDEIAVSAARLVVDEGMEYAAARQAQGRTRSWPGAASAHPDMPRNEAVEDEVRTYIDIFCADTQPAELRALRELAALLWMERLAEFRPHLAGAVWRGTATRHVGDPPRPVLRRCQELPRSTLDQPGRRIRRRRRQQRRPLAAVSDMLTLHRSRCCRTGR
jgi:hypothetical protein